MTDKEILLNLIGKVTIDDQLLKELADHVWRCQNDCNTDGSITPEVWTLCKDILDLQTKTKCNLKKLEDLSKQDWLNLQFDEENRSF